MTDALSKASFDPLVGEAFLTGPADEAPALRLTETRALGSAMRDGGAFALTFQGPPEPFLAQATYRLSHETLGEVDIFIVPVEQREDGFVYEAVFT